MEPVIIDTDPGIDDALAIMLAYLSPQVDIHAITLTHGNVGMECIQKNAVVILNALAEHQLNRAKTNRCPVLAVGASFPLKTTPPDATYFHGEDGLGMIYKELYAAPKNWKQQFSMQNDDKVNRGFVPTCRDAADEILYQLKHIEPPLSCTLIALGPLTNLALAYQRNPATFSRARRIIIMGGAVHVPGNISPYAEFNFRCDPDAANIIMRASQGFSPQLDRQALLGCEDGTVSKKDYDKYIVTLPDSSPLYRLIKAFMCWSFKATADYYHLDFWSVYDAYIVFLMLEMIQGKHEKKTWKYEYLDLTVETRGEYTLGMCCVDRREYQKDKTPWSTRPNNVQTFLKGNRHGFRTTILNTLFNRRQKPKTLYKKLKKYRFCGGD
ncbi:Inosine/uridine-preferring nucleoside hydrolase domain-containing protein [Chlamydoabsidia padenii]|nr:Inosine/uridine-preferring nucleoside hydrolase domain-containing protein [Chlamydoabsidia padenii]